MTTINNVQLKIDEKDNEKEANLFICCGGCCMLIFTLAFAAAVISFYVFGILFLVQDNELCKQCNGSELWAYVLVTLILNACSGNSAREKDKSPRELLVFLISTFIINGSMGVWGGIELWVNSCDSLIESNIWIFGTWAFGIQMTSCFLCLCIIPGLCCKASDERNEHKKNQKIIRNAVENIV
tara:strand:- start:76 stop:624 length:549 start_codon:yes stop_codon:yes gene_type:complete